MKFPSLILSLAAAALTATAACASTPAQQADAKGQARIPFANNGGIRDWRGVDRDTVYIQASDRVWYKATLMSPSSDLPFANTIGFDTGANGTFDRFSTIVVRGQRFAISSFERIDGEPPKKQAEPDSPHE